MTRELSIERLTASAFGPFGDVIELADAPSFLINRDQCGRHHDLARIDVATAPDDGRVGISLFDGRPYPLPHTLDLLERHPLGSQAFLPMTSDPFLVIVAPDDGGRPGQPQAFATDGRQGVNYHRGTWHGVLTPIGRRSTFAVVDRIGEGDNLEEHHLDAPWQVIDPDGLLTMATDDSPR